MRIVLATCLDALRSRSRKVKRGFTYPLGIGYVGKVLEDAGHDVFLYDGLPLTWTPDAVVEQILASKPDLVGLSVLSHSFASAREMAALLKARGNVPVIAGGPHVTCYPEESLAEAPGIDFLVLGEGEVTGRHLVEAIERGEDVAGVPGIAYRAAGGRAIRTAPRPPIDDLDTLPIPYPRRTPPSWLYRPEPLYTRRWPVTNVVTSRGCPYGRCTFCVRAGLIEQPYRRRSVPHVMAELEHVVRRFGVAQVAVYDDAFPVEEAYVVAFCEALRASGLDLTWECEARASDLTPAMVRAMAGAGCHLVQLGIETGSPRLRRILNKGVSLPDVERAVRLLREARVQSLGTFMLGLPTETPRDADETVSLATRLGLDWAQFALYRPLRGTPLARVAARTGRLARGGAEWDYYASMGRGSRDPSVVRYVPEAYRDEAHVEATIRRAYRRFYLRLGFVRSYLRHGFSWWGLRRLLLGAGYLRALLRTRVALPGPPLRALGKEATVRPRCRRRP